MDVDIGNLSYLFSFITGSFWIFGFIFSSVSPCKICSLFFNDVLSSRVDFIDSSLYLSLWGLVISLRKLSFPFSSMLPVSLC